MNVFMLVEMCHGLVICVYREGIILVGPPFNLIFLLSRGKVFDAIHKCHIFA